MQWACYLDGGSIAIGTEDGGAVIFKVDMAIRLIVLSFVTQPESKGYVSVSATPVSLKSLSCNSLGSRNYNPACSVYEWGLYSLKSSGLSACFFMASNASELNYSRARLKLQRQISQQSAIYLIHHAGEELTRSRQRRYNWILENELDVCKAHGWLYLHTCIWKDDRSITLIVDLGLN